VLFFYSGKYNKMAENPSPPLVQTDVYEMRMRLFMGVYCVYYVFVYEKVGGEESGREVETNRLVYPWGPFLFLFDLK